ncbi:cupin domain-containing protein [Pseudonocardia sp. RS11V-5]|uniref:cupin domain-containing protein n=1 Tax=Pseudonocardia terrae TaxID=2905831 RepID=UPI001E453A5F|nr:cupin domain-containing protein [Pseudonocardia terrae]MCE3556446.1 cupin domain-containing protein [Pseudonocardia terrae]
MNIVEITSAPARRAPTPDGPTVRLVSDPDGGAPVAVLHVTVPAGGSMPEHDHGPSHVVLIPLRGRIRLHHDGVDHDLAPGTATHIGIGERVSLANPATDNAELLAVAAPPDFAAALSRWPAASPATA